MDQVTCEEFIQQSEALILNFENIREDFRDQFEKISGIPFRDLRLHERYNPSRSIAVVRELMILTNQFYQSHLMEKNAKKITDTLIYVQRLKRTAIIYEMIGLVNGISFPEKDKLRLDQFDEKSDLNYLEVLFYLALVLAMPEELKPELSIASQYDITCESDEGPKKYRLDFAIIKTNEKTILYDIECDGERHKNASVMQEDKRREAIIKKQFPECGIVRLDKSKIYEAKNKDQNAMKTALDFWDKVKMERMENAEIPPIEIPCIETAPSLTKHIEECDQPMSFLEQSFLADECIRSLFGKLSKRTEIERDQIVADQGYAKKRRALRHSVVAFLIVNPIYIGILALANAVSNKAQPPPVPHSIEIGGILILLLALVMILLVYKYKLKEALNKTNGLRSEKEKLDKEICQIYRRDQKAISIIPVDYQYPIASNYICSMLRNKMAVDMMEALSLYDKKLCIWIEEKRMQKEIAEEKWMNELLMKINRSVVTDIKNS